MPNMNENDETNLSNKWVIIVVMAVVVEVVMVAVS